MSGEWSFPWHDGEPCPEPCDHCRPDDWHDCILEAGHDGLHTCSRSFR